MSNVIFERIASKSFSHALAGVLKYLLLIPNDERLGYVEGGGEGWWQ